MTPTLRERFERLSLRLHELDASLADPQLMADHDRWRKLAREQAEAAQVVAQFRRCEQRERDLAAARELQADPEMAEMATEEITAAEADLERLHAELQASLLPRDPDDERNAFVEIRAGTGGDESALFAGDLVRMYLRYCERRGWRTEVISESPAELGGWKELVLRVAGERVFESLRFESGGHRVQRVPATES
ncbi:MAG: PCRF domain-containing protein, partial [Rubrivivax sp.]|nr:PCRF domain-containing protein [Rubrivivax sp.]